MTDRLLASHSRFISHGQGDRIKVRGGWLSFLAVGEQTGGAYALIETANDPLAGIPLHVHEREDETWKVSSRLRPVAGHSLQVGAIMSLDRETCRTVIYNAPDARW